MRIALYLRRSTNEEMQPDSLNIQERLLHTIALERGHLVIRTYDDDASGRTSERSGFQRSIADVQAGAPFEAVMVRDVSRWGRFDNIDESGYWEFFCNLHGVRVIYAEEGFRNDSSPYDALLKTVRRVQAAELSREKSRYVQRAGLPVHHHDDD